MGFNSGLKGLNTKHSVSRSSRPFRIYEYLFLVRPQNYIFFTPLYERDIMTQDLTAHKATSAAVDTIQNERAEPGCARTRSNPPEVSENKA
jgi:hypothetical protein